MALARRDVKMINGVDYQKIDDDGLHITIDGKSQLLEVDTVIVCAGQLPLRALYDDCRGDILTSALSAAPMRQ